MKIIGIDIGTTSISIVLISLPEGTLLQAVTLPNDTFLPTAHPWERLQDPAAILTKVLPALDGLLSAYSDVAAIGLTGHGRTGGETCLTMTMERASAAAWTRAMA